MTNNEKELLDNFRKYDERINRDYTDEELMEEIEEMMNANLGR